MTSPINIGLNSLQLVLPFIALGDFASDLWFIAEIGSQKILILVLAIVSLVIKLAIGICKSCRWDDHYLLPPNWPIKFLYYFCHFFDCSGFFIYLYQRC